MGSVRSVFFALALLVVQEAREESALLGFDLDGARFDGLGFWNHHFEHPVFHAGLNFRLINVLGQLETSLEFSGHAFEALEHAVILFLRLRAFTRYAQAPFFDVDLDRALRDSG